MQDNDANKSNDSSALQMQPDASSDDQQIGTGVQEVQEQEQPMMEDQALAEPKDQDPALVSEQSIQDSPVEHPVVDETTPSLGAQTSLLDSNPAGGMPSSPSVSMQASESLATPVPSSAPVNAAVSTGDSNKKGGKALAIILALSTVAVVAIVAIVVLLMNNSGLPSVSDVEKYCKDNGLKTMTGHQSGDEDVDYELDYVACSGGSSDNISSIQYAVYDKPLKEIGGIDDSIAVLYEDGVLVNDGDYKKIYMSFFSSSSYMITKGNTYIEVSGEREAMKKALIDLGYPDDKWADASMDYEDDYDYDDDYDDNYDDNYDYQVTLDDSDRRYDMLNVVSALIDYKYDDKGIMSGPSYWEGATNIDCEADNIACQFVDEYMDDEDMSIVDPDGTPYSVYITENLMSNEGITMSFGSDLSKLVLNDGEYTIGGSSPFGAHVIYIIPGATCNTEYDGAAKAQEMDNFAVLYQLKDDGAYCADL